MSPGLLAQPISSRWWIPLGNAGSIRNATSPSCACATGVSAEWPKTSDEPSEFRIRNPRSRHGASEPPTTIDATRVRSEVAVNRSAATHVGSLAVVRL